MMRHSMTDFTEKSRKVEAQTVELMYIRHNARSAKEVRLMAREEVGASHGAPANLNQLLSTLSPRRALIRLPPRRSLEMVPLGYGTDWEGGWQEKTGEKLRGSGVRWAGGETQRSGGYAQGTSTPRGIVPSGGNTARSIKWGHEEESNPWLKNERQKRDVAKAAGVMPVVNRAGKVRTPGLLKKKSNHFSWPLHHGEESRWVSFARKLKHKRQGEDKSGSFAGAAESAFGAMAAKSFITRSVTLEVMGQDKLPRIPKQWLHAGLTTIVVRACQLESLPREFGNLCPNLENLYLQHNQMSFLPESCANLTKLRELGLTSNQFLEFPDPVQYHINLEILSLQCNSIRRVPSNIAYCVKLKSLYLANNPLERLPPALGLITSLQALTLDSTERMLLPPKRICDAGDKAILIYLQVLMHNALVGFRNKMSQSFLQARAAFQHFDASNDGALDKDEIREALQWMKMDTTYFDDMMVILDANNDQNVDFHEFFACMNSSNPVTKSLRDPFDELKDLIPIEELEEALKEITNGIWTVQPTGQHVPWKGARWNEVRAKASATYAFVEAGSKRSLLVESTKPASKSGWTGSPKPEIPRQGGVKPGPKGRSTFSPLALSPSLLEEGPAGSEERHEFERLHAAD